MVQFDSTALVQAMLPYSIILWTLTAQLRYSYTVQHYMLDFDSAASVQLALYNIICWTLTVQLRYSYTVQYYMLHFDSAA